MARPKAPGKCRRCQRAAHNEFFDERGNIVYLCDLCAENAIRTNEENGRGKTK